MTARSGSLLLFIRPSHAWVLALLWMPLIGQVGEAEARNIRADCTALVMAYAVTRDQVDVAANLALFTENAVFKLGPREVKGHEAIGNFLRERGKTPTRHLITTVHIKPISAERAVGTTYFLVLTSAENPNEAPVQVDGFIMAEYQDTFVKTQGGWKFARREAKRTYHHGQ